MSEIVTVDIDERDLRQLEVDGDNPAKDESGDRQLCPIVVGDIRRSTADKVVEVATIDTFQGCEADIVILSTVRNQGLEESSAQGMMKKTIGFLKVR